MREKNDFLFVCLPADYPSVDFIHESLQDSLGFLHMYLRPQVLSTNESPEIADKLRQTVQPLATIAAVNSQFKGRLSPKFLDRRRTSFFH